MFIFLYIADESFMQNSCRYLSDPLGNGLFDAVVIEVVIVALLCPVVLLPKPLRAFNIVSMCALRTPSFKECYPVCVGMSFPSSCNKIVCDCLFHNACPASG